jgi:hypothetical protein
LPDGLFSNQKKFGQILGVLAIENLGIFYDHLVFFTAIVGKYFKSIWYILWSFGIFLPILVFCTTKNLAIMRGRRLLSFPIDAWSSLKILKNYLSVIRSHDFNLN